MACLAAGTGVDGCSHTVQGGSSLSLRSEALFFPKVSVVRMGEAKGLSVKAMAVVSKFKGTQRRQKHLMEMIEKKPNESSAKKLLESEEALTEIRREQKERRE